MKICIVVEQMARVSGTSIHVSQSARQLDKNGHEVTVISLGNVNASLNLGGAAHISAGSLPDHILNGDKTVGLLQTALFDLADRKEIEIIHTHYPFATLAAANAKCVFDVPFVFTMHGYELRSSLVNRNQLTAFKMASSIADKAIYVSSAIEDQTRRLCAFKLPPSAIIPDGVDDDFLERQATHPKAREDFLYVGRLSTEKGVLDLAQAFLGYRKSGGQRRLILAGAGQEYNNLCSIMDKANQSQNVTFLGEVPHYSLIELYKSAFAVLVPSHVEALGTVALESLATGTPVIASSVGGLRSLVIDGENGLFTTPESPQELAEKMSTLDSDMELYLRLAGNAPKSIKNYRWSNVAKQLVNIYQDIASNSPHWKSESLARIECEFGSEGGNAWKGAGWDSMNG